MAFNTIVIPVHIEHSTLLIHSRSPDHQAALGIHDFEKHCLDIAIDTWFSKSFSKVSWILKTKAALGIDDSDYPQSWADWKPEKTSSSSDAESADTW